MLNSNQRPYKTSYNISTMSYRKKKYSIYEETSWPNKKFNEKALRISHKNHRKFIPSLVTC